MVKAKYEPPFFVVGETETANLTGDFLKLLGKFSPDKTLAEEICRLVVAKYSESHRAYHNLSHISALRRGADDFVEKFDDLQSVELAIWFHDVIYQPKSAKNESESAKMAVEKLSELNAPKITVARVEAMILATHNHAAEKLDDDGKLFLDLDLAILGARAGIYEHYSAAIRREYSFVPWFLYRRARRKILENFIRRDHLYFAVEMREKYEAAARFNIENEIKKLS